MMRRVFMMVLFCLPLVYASSASGSDAPGEVASLVERGQASFREASSLRRDDPDRARELFGEAIDAWAGAMAEGGFVNGKLLYNTANAHLLRDEIGLAILHYEAALELMPGDRNTVLNLAQARLRVPGGVSGGGRGGAMETVLFFHSGLSERARFAVGVVAFALTWTLAGCVVLRALPRGAWWACAALSLVWIGSAASLGYESVWEPRAGVIVGDDIVGRKGPDASGYEPSFTEALSPGIVFTLVEERGEWMLIRLRDGRETWVPRPSARFVDSIVSGASVGSSI